MPWSATRNTARRVPFGEQFEDERLRAIALHARQLGFNHPMTNEPVDVIAPTSAAWEAILPSPPVMTSGKIGGCSRFGDVVLQSFAQMQAEVEQRFADDEHHEHADVAAERHRYEAAEQDRDVQHDDPRVRLQHQHEHDGSAVLAAAEVVDEERPEVARRERDDAPPQVLFGKHLVKSLSGPNGPKPPSDSRPKNANTKTPWTRQNRP